MYFVDFVVRMFVIIVVNVSRVLSNDEINDEIVSSQLPECDLLTLGMIQ